MFDEVEIYDYEVVMLLISLVVIIEIIINYAYIKRIPGFVLLTLSFSFFAAGAVLTVLEGIFWHDVLNMMENISYMASAVTFALWCFLVFLRPEVFK